MSEVPLYPLEISRGCVEVLGRHVGGGGVHVAWDLVFGVWGLRFGCRSWILGFKVYRVTSLIRN
jgi:hypothetical protein